jgi:hypothetical protein
MSGVQWIGIAVTVVLFVITHAIAVFKWISTLTASLKEITARFEERTSALVYDIRKISGSVETMAATVVRFERIEEVSRDHEVRIRTLEQEDGE